MTVKEINVTLKNDPGQLSTVSEILDFNGINIIAFYVSTKGRQGSLRFVANDPDKAVVVLKAQGYKIRVTEVIACEIPHHPGGLNSILKPLKKEGINIAYIYPCISCGWTENTAIIILGAIPANRERILDVLKDNWIRILHEELYRL
ncbi:MAG: acetolactate synthase [Thermodesulfobacteriota bacterium]